MAQYFTDFSEYATGIQPSDWTRRISELATWTVQDDATSEGGKVLRASALGSNSREGFSLDVIDTDPDRADAEVFFRCKWPTAPEFDCFAMFRASGASSAAANLYRVGARRTTASDNETSQIAKYVTGSFTPIIAGLSGSRLDNTYYNVLAQVRGQLLKLKIWLATDPEPAAWTIEGSDTQITAAGWIGLFKFTSAACDIDVFSVGTGTDSAPRSLPVAGLSIPTAAHEGTTGYTGAVTTTIGSGTLYWVVTNSATKPTPAEVKTAKDHIGAAAVSSGNKPVSTTGEQTVSGSGLSSGVTYYVHFVQNSGSGDSAVVSSAGFSFSESVPPPTNVVVTGITTTAASISWQAGV
jgi:hypothetical protein